MQVFMDVDLYGRESKPGQALELLDEDAIKNAIILWITSDKGDYLYNPGAGGMLRELVFKQLSPDSISMLEFNIRNAVSIRFSPSILITRLEFEPNYEKRYLKILLEYKGITSDKNERVVFYTKSNFDGVVNTYEDIDFIEENLYNFCKARKPSMNKEIFTYNATESSWVWGKYRFVNLTPLDPYFSPILSLVNNN